MTAEQFDKIVGYLINIVLPPSCNDDPPVVAEKVIDILDKHIEEVRGSIIRHRHEVLDDDGGDQGPDVLGEPRP